jgi:hypothetical protein
MEISTKEKSLRIVPLAELMAAEGTAARDERMYLSADLFIANILSP